MKSGKSDTAERARQTLHSSKVYYVVIVKRSQSTRLPPRKSGARDLELHKHTHSHTHIPETETLLEPQLTEECRREKTRSPPLPSRAGGGKERRRGYKTRWEGDAHRLFPVRAIFSLLFFNSFSTGATPRISLLLLLLLPPPYPTRFPPPVSSALRATGESGIGGWTRMRFNYENYSAV